MSLPNQTATSARFACSHDARARTLHTCARGTIVRAAAWLLGAGLLRVVGVQAALAPHHPAEGRAVVAHDGRVHGEARGLLLLLLSSSSSLLFCVIVMNITIHHIIMTYIIYSSTIIINIIIVIIGRASAALVAHPGVRLALHVVLYLVYIYSMCLYIYIYKYRTCVYIYIYIDI